MQDLVGRRDLGERAIALALLAIVRPRTLAPARQSESDLATRLRDGLDLVASPASFHLRYETTKIGQESTSAPAFREFLREQDDRPRAFDHGHALVADLRTKSGVSDPSTQMTASSVYVGGTSTYRIRQGRTRFYQELEDLGAAMPVLLKAPEVTLVYHRGANRLEFVESSQPLDLRTIESMTAPLPLDSIARDHWLERPALATTEVGEDEISTALEDAGLVLGIKYTKEAPHLPVAAWVRPTDSAFGETRIGAFLSYRKSDSGVVPSTVMSVRENEWLIRIDEYMLDDLTRPGAGEEPVMDVRPGVELISRTGGRLREFASLDDLPEGWPSLVAVR